MIISLLFYCIFSICYYVVMSDLGYDIKNVIYWIGYFGIASLRASIFYDVKYFLNSNYDENEIEDEYYE